MEACLSRASRSSCTRRKFPAGRMVSEDAVVLGSLNIRDKASGFVFFEPGRYVTWKENLVKNNAHLA